MSTKGTTIHGDSDDLISFEGDVHGEVSCYGTDDRKQGVMLVCSDGTVLEVKYGKAGLGVWAITIIRAGDLFDTKTDCDDEDATIHSDVVTFAPGIKWVMAASDWERVK